MSCMTEDEYAAEEACAMDVDAFYDQLLLDDDGEIRSRESWAETYPLCYTNRYVDNDIAQRIVTGTLQSV